MSEILWQWIRYSINPGMLVLAEALWTEKRNPYPEYLFQCEQSAAPSMMELVLYNQVSTRCLVYPVRECYPNRDSVLIFVIGRLDTQQWMQPVGPDKWENHVVEPMNDHPCYYCHFFMSPWEEWVTRQIGWLMFTGWIILLTWLWRSSLLFGEHLNWKQIYIYFLPI